MKNKLPKMTPPAFYGLAGDVINMIQPHTEADESALLCQLLTCFGSACGRTAYFTAEASRHYTNLYVLLVGLSGKGRKGSALSQIKALLDESAFGEWKAKSIVNGLSSGEGLINKVSDKYLDTLAPEPFKLLDTNKIVKELLCVESEFGNVLQNLKRQGNTLSPTLRQAWDGSKLEVLTRKDPLVAEDAHISIIAHITYDELKALLNPVDIKNGLGNRFLFFCSQRSKKLPEGSKINTETLAEFKVKIRNALEFAKNQKEIDFSHCGRERWFEIYEELSEERFGIVGDLTGRAEAQVRRVAMILALMNHETSITAECLDAAYSVFQYTVSSIEYIFGNSFGDPVLDTILNLLKEAGEAGLTSTELSQKFSNNYSISTKLEFLLQKDLIIKLVEKGIGRPVTRFKLSIVKRDSQPEYELNEESRLI